MLKEYAVNGGLQWELSKRQLKRHPKWRKSRWIRRILLTLCIVAPIVGVFFSLSNPGFAFRELDGSVADIDNILNICFSILFFSVIPLIITLPYFAVLRGKCFDESNYKSNETLCLTDDGIQNVFLPSDEMSSDAMFEEQMPYEGMDRLIYNEYHERFQVFGKLKSIKYLDYQKGTIDYKEEHKSKKGYSRSFYAYYENFEDFMNTVSNQD
jgi:hypothetical protein